MDDVIKDMLGIVLTNQVTIMTSLQTLCPSASQQLALNEAAVDTLRALKLLEKL